MRWVNPSAERFQQALTTGICPDPRLSELVAITRAFPTAATVVPGPRPEFVAALRERLMAEAAALPVRPPAPRQAPVARNAKVINVGLGAVRKGLIGAAAAGLVVAGVSVASRSSVPGSALYPVKQLLDDAAVALADPGYSRGMTYLSQAQEHISDTRQLLGQPSVVGQDVAQALTAASDTFVAAQTEFAAGYAQTKSEQNLLALPDFAARALPQIDALKPDVPAEATDQWQRLRDLVASHAKPTSQSLPGVPGSAGESGAVGGSGSPTASPSSSAGSSASSSASNSVTGPSAGAPSGGGVPGIGIPGTPRPSLPTAPVHTPPGVTLPSIPLPSISQTIAPTGLPVSPTVGVTGTPTIPSVDPFRVGETVRVLSSGLTGTIVAINAETATVQVTVAGVATRVVVPLAGLGRP